MVGCSSRTLIAYSDIMNLKPDMVIINSSLPKLNISDFDFVTSFVYTADAPHFAAQAYENNAVDYLLKPFSLERFERCIVKARSKSYEGGVQLLKEKINNDYFFVRNESKGNRVIRIKLADIVFIKASQNYVTVQLVDRSHLIYLTMKELEDFLPADRFFRVHKSYMINEEHISYVDGNKICMEDKYTILAGVSYRKELLIKLQPRLITSKRRFEKGLSEPEEIV